MGVVGLPGEDIDVEEILPEQLADLEREIALLMDRAPSPSTLTAADVGLPDDTKIRANDLQLANGTTVTRAVLEALRFSSELQQRSPAVFHFAFSPDQNISFDSLSFPLRVNAIIVFNFRAMGKYAVPTVEICLDGKQGDSSALVSDTELHPKTKQQILSSLLEMLRTAAPVAIQRAEGERSAAEIADAIFNQSGLGFADVRSALRRAAWEAIHAQMLPVTEVSDALAAERLDNKGAAALDKTMHALLPPTLAAYVEGKVKEALRPFLPR